MTTIEALERQLHEHTLEDAERYGETMAKLALMGRDLTYLVKTQEAHEERLEKTGDQDVSRLERRAAFWPNILTVAICSLVTSGITGLVVHFLAHR
jgi:hypothetical protein